MATIATSTNQNILPVQALFNVDGTFNTFIGQGQPFSVMGANTISIVNTTVNANLYPTFTSVTSGGVTGLSISSSAITFNPSTATLTTTNFVGNLTGTSSATNNVIGGTQGNVLYQSAVDTTAFVPNSIAGYVLTSNGSSAPSWQPAFGGLSISSVVGATTYYPTFTTGVGSITAEYIDTGNLTYVSGVLNGTFNGSFGGGSGAFTTLSATSTVTINTTTNNQSYTTTGAGTIAISSGTTGSINNMAIGATTASSANFTTVSASGQITSTVTTGTAPFVISSTTPVANLSIGGNAATATTATTASNSAVSTTVSSSPYYPALVSATSGASLPINANSSLSYIPNTGVLSATGYTGSWQGNTIGATYGGTGQSTYVTGDILYASASNTLSKLAIGTNGYVLTIAGGVPTWAASSGSATAYSRTSVTASASQTTFSVTYTVGYVEVYLNGVLLNSADYTASSGTTVILAVGANAGDIVEFIAYNTATVNTPAGSNTQIQYNNGGALGASSAFTFTGNDVNIPFGTSNSATSSAKIALALSMIA